MDSVPAEQYVNEMLLCEEMQRDLSAIINFIKQTPRRFGVEVDPMARLSTGLLRADKLSELGKGRDHIKAALKAFATLNNVHVQVSDWESKHPFDQNRRRRYW